MEAADNNGFGGVSLQAIVSHGGAGCPRDQLHRCVKSAEPLLRNADYVFPSSNEDVLTVCRWGRKEKKKEKFHIYYNFIVRIISMLHLHKAVEWVCRVRARLHAFVPVNGGPTASTATAGGPRWGRTFCRSNVHRSNLPARYYPLSSPVAIN